MNFVYFSEPAKASPDTGTVYFGLIEQAQNGYFDEFSWIISAT